MKLCNAFLALTTGVVLAACGDLTPSTVTQVRGDRLNDEVGDDNGTDGAGHDVGDDNGTDGAGDDVGDDNGTDGAGHDVGDDNGTDGAGHDVGDDNGTDQQASAAARKLPRIATPADQQVVSGAAFSLQIAKTRPNDDDTYAFSATGLPAGLSIDEATGMISGTVTAAAGSYAVTVSAREMGERPGHRPSVVTFAVVVASL